MLSSTLEGKFEQTQMPFIRGYLLEISPMVPKKTISKCLDSFFFRYYLPLEKRVTFFSFYALSSNLGKRCGLSLGETCTRYTQSCFVSRLVKLDHWFWFSSCLNVVNTFLLFRSPWTLNKVVYFIKIWTNLNSVHSRMFYVNFEWNWSCASEEDHMI